MAVLEAEALLPRADDFLVEAPVLPVVPVRREAVPLTREADAREDCPEMAEVTLVDPGAEVVVRSDLRLEIREREPPDCVLRPLRFKLISAADWEREWLRLWLDLAVFVILDCEGVARDEV